MTLKARWLNWYHRQCAPYPVRWYWPIYRIFGGPGRDTVYMTRVFLTPKIPPVPALRIQGGQWYLHVFHREDLDRDPHDHPFPFWTLPLNMGYTEDVYNPDSQCWTSVRVPRWRWSYRHATHCHRVVATDSGRWPLVTIVYRGHTERRWGFWVHAWDAIASTKRRWVKQQEYLYGGESANANIPGADETCPGQPGGTHARNV